jgi:hypothetical protein
VEEVQETPVGVGAGVADGELVEGEAGGEVPETLNRSRALE